MVTSPDHDPIAIRLLPDTAEVLPSGQLAIGGCSVLDLAAEFGTPLFIYDEEHLRERCQQAARAFHGSAAYASKAFLCRAMAQLAYQEGLAIDVASLGEYEISRSAGVPPERIVFHGNNKSAVELHSAVRDGVGRIVVDSLDELSRLESVCSALGLRQQILIRINPGIDVHTNEKVATGTPDSKFGLPVNDISTDEAIISASRSQSVELKGLHVHIGSQVFSAANFGAAVGRVVPQV
ncbi:MAG: diaminopimelate decarboxylase, partial [Microthrixaceae bacterium]|nr:diaminopimelate decarboxylase [Microthrixaceae bacterium]